MHILLMLALLSPLASADCVNKIAASEIAKAIALEPGAGAKACGPADACVCFDGIDWEAAEYINGALRVNAAKKLAKDQRVEAELAAKVLRRKQREERIQNIDWTQIKTIADLKEVLKDLAERD